MSARRRYCPEWSWWVRAGERVMLGLSLEQVTGIGSTNWRGAVFLGLERFNLELRRGEGVVVALRESGLILPLEAWCLLEGGERTGKLGESMREVGELLRGRDQQRREFIGQLWYPALVGATAFAVMGLILWWVIPQMREVGASMGAGEQLPWLTENIGRLYGGVLLAALGITGAVAGGVTSLKWMAARRAAWGLAEERLYRWLPIVGGVRCCRRESRLLGQLGTLLRGGVTLPEALEMAAAASSNQWERAQVGHFRTRLLMGAGFEAAVRDCCLFSQDSLPLLEVGQESGQLDAYMQRLSGELAEQASASLKVATRLIEPLFLLFLSGAVGGLILAYLLPMVRMLEQAGGAF